MRKFLKVLAIIIAIIAGLWIIVFFWPVEPNEEKEFIAQGARENEPMAIAHRGGAAEAPESTLVAFENSIDAGVDMLEYDAHITEDGKLVAIHDETVDRTTDGQGSVNELTLEEIKELDAGYNFQDEEGNYPYRDMGVEIPTLSESFNQFSNERHLIELKDTNNPDLYEPMIQEIWKLIQEYNMEDQVMIASFDHEINERFQEVSNGEVAIGAGEQEAYPFVIKHILRLNGIAHSNADALQLPTEQYGIDLTNSNLLTGAEERNMDVYYWTINDEETMRDLIEKNVDGVMTDRPSLLTELLDEKN